MKKNRSKRDKRTFTQESDSLHPARPLQAVLTLGKEEASYPSSEDDGTVDSSNFDFDKLPMERMDYHEIDTRFRIYKQQFNLARDKERAKDVLLKAHNLWIDYLDHVKIASVVRLENSPKKAFYQEEYTRALEAYDTLYKRYRRMCLGLLQSPYLESFSAFTGKLFFLHWNSEYILQDLPFANLQKEEKEIMDRFSIEREKASQMPVIRSSVKQCDILYDNLLQKRFEIAHTLSFDSYRFISALQHQYQNYDFEELRKLRESMKRYLLPIHRYKEMQFAQAMHGPTANERFVLGKDKVFSLSYENISDNIKESYERFMGDEDWELRHLNDYFPEASNEKRESFYPASPTFIYREGAKAFYAQVLEVCEKLVPEAYKGFLKELGQKSLIRLDLSREDLPLAVEFLAKWQLPILSGSYRGSSAFVANFLQQIGLCYAYMQDTNTNKSISHSFSIPFLHKRFWALGFEFLALEHMGAFFPNEARLYAKERLYKMLRVILIRMMLDEFEETVYRDGQMQMLDRLTLWRRLRKEYALELYTEEYFWLDKDIAKRLMEKPLINMVEVLADYSALLLWQDSLKNPKKTAEEYTKFCALGLQDGFVDLLALSGRKDPFDLGNCKSLAFALASYIEEDDETQG